MITSSLLNEQELSLIVRYSVEDDEKMNEAVVDAFIAAGVSPFDRPTYLADWINPDIFEDLEWSSDRPLYLCTRIWNHQVMMTPEEIRIYTFPVR